MTVGSGVRGPGDALRSGTVERFDAEVGLGVIVAADGDRVDFHCTAIADGTRTIDEGAPVVFVVGWAGPGRWEARRVLTAGP